MMKHVIDLFSGPTAATLAETILHSLWQEALIAGLLWLALRALPIKHAELRYAVSCTALFLMLAAPVTTWNLIVQSGSSNAVLFTSLSADLESAAVQAAPSAQRGEPAPGKHLPYLSHHFQVTVAFYTLGATLMLLRFFGGLAFSEFLYRRGASDADVAWKRRLHALRRTMRIRRRIRLVASTGAESPCVLGIFAPIIILPTALITGLPPEQVDAILAHELAHIRRGDYAVNLLQGIAEALLFYHPAVWWVSKRIRIEREYCCDDEAARQCASVVSYARTLTALEQRRIFARPAVAIYGGGLRDRIHRLILPHPERSRWTVSAFIGVLLVGLATAFVACRDANVSSGPEPIVPSEMEQGPVTDVITWLYDVQANHPEEALSTAASLYATSDNTDLRESLTFFFASFLTSESDRFLLSIAKQDPDEEVRASAIWAFAFRLIGPTPADMAPEEYRARAGLRQERVRLNEAVYPEIANIARNEGEAMAVRRQAVAALAASPTALPVLIELYERRTDPNVLFEAIVAMGSQGADGIRYLDHIVQTEADPAFKRSAVWGLQRSGSPDAVPLLAKIAELDAELRFQALRALEAYGDRVPGAREALDELRRKGIQTTGR